MKIEYTLLIVLIGLGLSVALTQLGTATRTMTEHATYQTTEAINDSFAGTPPAHSDKPE